MFSTIIICIENVDALAQAAQSASPMTIVGSHGNAKGAAAVKL